MEQVKENTRTKNAILNITFGYLSLFLLKILAFFVRKLFLQYLSIEYLGIDNLYNNVLMILSLPKMAVDVVAVYMLYEPVANHDDLTTSSLLKTFNRIYVILALCTFAIGTLLMPFLHLIVSSNLSIKDLLCFYLLCLANTIFPYFVASRVAFLMANQEQRIQTIVMFITAFVLRIINVIILSNWANYYYYLLATLFTTMISNILLYVVCNRIHKETFLFKEKRKLDTNKIINKVKDAFVYRLFNDIINRTDDIFISILVNTVTVGLYSNYCVLVVSIQEFMMVIHSSLTSGIGNLSVKEDYKKQGEVFDTTLLIFHFLGALGLIGFSMLLNNFIALWLGQEYLFDQLTVFIIAFNFYICNITSPISIFREANGLFGKVKYLLEIRAIINIMFSIILGKLWGIIGILSATSISCLLTDFWYEPKILFKNVPFISELHYWKKQIKYIVTTFVCFVLCYFVIGIISGQSIVYFILKALLIVLITSLLFIIVSFKTKEQKRLIEILLTSNINKEKNINFKDC